MRKGVPQIKIPIRPDAVSIEAIEPYIDEVFSQFAKNAEQIRRDYDFYCLNHPIYAKERKLSASERSLLMAPNSCLTAK